MEGGVRISFSSVAGAERYNERAVVRHAKRDKRKEFLKNYTGSKWLRGIRAKQAEHMTDEEKEAVTVATEEEAVKVVSTSIKRNWVRVEHKNRPIGSFLFLGKKYRCLRLQNEAGMHTSHWWNRALRSFSHPARFLLHHRKKSHKFI